MSAPKAATAPLDIAKLREASEQGLTPHDCAGAREGCDLCWYELEFFAACIPALLDRIELLEAGVAK